MTAASEAPRRVRQPRVVQLQPTGQRTTTASADPARSSWLMLPPVSGEAYDRLKADIAANGVTVPIVVDIQGRVIDGDARQRAARELGLECPYVITAFGDLLGERMLYALKANAHRAQLDEAATVRLVDELLAGGMSPRAIAAASGISLPLIEHQALAAATRRRSSGWFG